MMVNASWVGHLRQGKGVLVTALERVQVLMHLVSLANWLAATSKAET